MELLCHSGGQKWRNNKIKEYACQYSDVFKLSYLNIIYLAVAMSTEAEQVSNTREQAACFLILMCSTRGKLNSVDNFEIIKQTLWYFYCLIRLMFIWIELSLQRMIYFRIYVTSRTGRKRNIVDNYIAC